VINIILRKYCHEVHGEAVSTLNSTNLRTARKFQRYYIQTFAGEERKFLQ
jgi:hypothetical protein